MRARAVTFRCWCALCGEVRLGAGQGGSAFSPTKAMDVTPELCLPGNARELENVISGSWHERRTDHRSPGLPSSRDSRLARHRREPDAGGSGGGPHSHVLANTGGNKSRRPSPRNRSQDPAEEITQHVWTGKAWRCALPWPANRGRPCEEVLRRHREVGESPSGPFSPAIITPSRATWPVPSDPWRCPCLIS